jgi:hypothetical protein
MPSQPDLDRPIPRPQLQHRDREVDSLTEIINVDGLDCLRLGVIVEKYAL